MLSVRNGLEFPEDLNWIGSILNPNFPSLVFYFFFQWINQSEVLDIPLTNHWLWLSRQLIDKCEKACPPERNISLKPSISE